MIEVDEQKDKETFTCKGIESLEKTFYSKDRPRCPKDKEPSKYFTLTKGEKGWTITSSFFIGVDWLDERKTAIRISSKFNDKEKQLEIDCLGMLEEALREPENFEQLDGLLDVHFDQPSIPIPKQDDILSLFLLSEFLHTIRRITEKGLKKSYYFIETNQNAKIKGKLLLTQNIKKNNVKGNFSDNYCRHQEFGTDIPENRLLKKAMTFASRLLDTYPPDIIRPLKQILTNIAPKWKSVKEECIPSKIHEGRINPFFKEYTIAIKLAKMILKKKSCNQVLHDTDMTSTPPYWIDMSKLFEMFVLTKLRNEFGKRVIYHPRFIGQEPDYLLTADKDRQPYIIDAKYKRYGGKNIEKEDIRQVSGYCRIKGVRNRLGVTDNSLIPCLIVYPEYDGYDVVPSPDKWEDEGRYLDIFKLGLKLPITKALSQT